MDGEAEATLAGLAPTEFVVAATLQNGTIDVEQVVQLDVTVT